MAWTRRSTRSALEWLIVATAALLVLIEALDQRGCFVDLERGAIYTALAGGGTVDAAAPKAADLLHYMGVPSPSTVVELRRPEEPTWENTDAQVVAVRGDDGWEKIATIDALRAWTEAKPGWVGGLQISLAAIVACAGIALKAIPLNTVGKPEDEEA